MRRSPKGPRIVPLAGGLVTILGLIDLLIFADGWVEGLSAIIVIAQGLSIIYTGSTGRTWYRRGVMDGNYHARRALWISLAEGLSRGMSIYEWISTEAERDSPRIATFRREDLNG